MLRLIEKSDSTVCQVENPSKFRRHTHWATEIYEQSRHNCISLHNIAIALLLPLFNFNRSRASPSIKEIFSHLRIWNLQKVMKPLFTFGNITFCWLALFSITCVVIRNEDVQTLHLRPAKPTILETQKFATLKKMRHQNGSKKIGV